MTRTEFIEAASKLHNNKYDYSKVPEVFKTSQSKINKIPIICPIHGVFYQTTRQHLNTSGCEKCSYTARGDKNRMTLHMFISKANKIHNCKYDYSLVKLGKRLTDPVTIICPAHGKFIKRPDKHLAGQGCQKCVKCHRRSAEEFLTTIKGIYKNKYDLSKVKFTKVQNKVTIGCPVHGDVEVVAMKLLLGLGCTKCNYARSEQLIVKFLEDHNLKYVKEFKLKNSEYSSLRYGFYLPDANILLEVNSPYHSKEITTWGGKEYLEDTMRRDNIKLKEAKAHGINLYYLAYTNNQDPASFLEGLIKILNIYYPYSDGKNLYKTIAKLSANVPIDKKMTLGDIAKEYSTLNKLRVAL